MFDQYGGQHRQESIGECVEGALEVSEVGLILGRPAVFLRESLFRRIPEDVQMGSTLRVEDDDGADIDDELKYDERPYWPFLDPGIRPTQVEHRDTEGDAAGHGRREGPCQSQDSHAQCLLPLVGCEVDHMSSQAIFDGDGYGSGMDQPK